MRRVRRGRRAICVAAATLTLVLGLLLAWQVRLQSQRAAEQRHLAQRLPVLTAAERLPRCMPGAAAPLKLLILGQSNAANHGEREDPRAGALDVWVPQGCVQARDPLPGGTGSGGSIWSRLPDALARIGYRRPLSVSIIAVDSTSIIEWSDDQGPLGRHLRQRLQALASAGWRPDLVLWQQGEADVQRGTTQASYVQGFERFRQNLLQEGITAPMLLAWSTWCEGQRNQEIRAAISRLLQRRIDLQPGADTDQLNTRAQRSDHCHFSRTGLTMAADLWARAIVAALDARPSPPVAATIVQAAPSSPR